MSGRMLLTAHSVITVDDDRRVVTDGAVLVDEGVIVEVGAADSLRARHSDVDVVDSPGCVIMPGWINTHAHLAMNVFRGLTDDVTLEEFLERLIAAEFEVRMSVERICTLRGDG